MNIRDGLLRAAMIVGCAALSATAPADTITPIGSANPVRECTIESIQDGSVIFVDAGGRQKRELDDIQTMGFAGLIELDQAEQALAKDDDDAAVNKLLLARLMARSDVQRIWIHARLSRVHDRRGETVQAAGHAAAVMRLSDDPYWRKLVPGNSVNEPTFAAAKEAFDNLQAASRSVKSAALKVAIERMMQQVQPVYLRLSKSYQGPLISPGSTFSGISVDAIAKGLMPPKPKPAPAPTSAPAASAPAAPTPAPSRPDQPAPTPERSAPAVFSAEDLAPKVIDSLLAQQKWTEALARCEAASLNPGQRDAAHLLFQYGSALSRTGRGADAAVQFARCAVLFPDASDASHSLIQIAIIYRDVYHQPATFHRLLQHALDLATMYGHESAVLLARELQGTS